MVKIWANSAQITNILYFSYGKMTNRLDISHIFGKTFHKFWPNLPNLWQF